MSKEDLFRAELKVIADQLHRQLDTNERYWTQEDQLIYKALKKVFEFGYKKGYRRLGVKLKVFKPSTPKKSIKKEPSTT